MMNSSIPLMFNVLQVVIPIFVVIIIGLGLCRCICHCNRRRVEQQLASERAQANHSSPVYIIPISHSDEEYNPPRYSVVQRTTPPPAYNESVVKPESPVCAPPTYFEAIGHELVSSETGDSTPASSASE